MTKSEEKFEKIMKSKGLSYEKIKETELKTPDYLVQIDSLKILFEIKELSNNPEQKKNLKNIYNNGAFLSEQGDFQTIDIHSKSIEQAIKTASTQLRDYSDEAQISLIVIADNRDFFFKDLNLVSQIKSSIIGSGHFQQDETGQVIELCRELGMFSKRKTYISVVVIMNMDSEDLLFLHNENAEISALIEPLVSLFPHHEYVVNTSIGKSWHRFSK